MLIRKVLLAALLLSTLALEAKDGECFPPFPPYPIAFGEIYTPTDQTQLNVTPTPALLTTFTANGLAFDTAPDHTADQITIGQTGTYEIDLSVSLAGSTSTWTFEVAVNGAPLPNIVFSTFGGNVNAVNGAVTGFASLSTGDVVTVLISVSVGSQTVTVRKANLNVSRIA